MTEEREVTASRLSPTQADSAQGGPAETGPGRPAQTGPAPALLPPNPVFRFYRGGAGIDQFRGLTPGTGPGAPEDWVASTTTVFGHHTEGLARFADGRLIRDAIESDPLGYLGRDHVARFGSNPGVLVKLLDAGERLAVHFHPGREFAHAKLGSDFGKTESWIILDAEPGAHMHLGLREPIDLDTLRRWVEQQDSQVMLEALNKVPVVAGDVLYVPAGTLHTIGAGITLIELQEPSDMSVVIEWQRFGVDNGDEHLRLGWDVVLPAADTEPSAPSRASLESPNAGDTTLIRLLPPEADAYFRAERLVIDGPTLTLEPEFSIVLGIAGELTISTDDHEPLRLPSGAAALIPFGAGMTTLSGSGAGGGTAIRCLPPTIDTEAGER
jgi:mannose-6-phosphate isomerase